MKIKVFKIRLDDAFRESDEARVNAFLENVEMKKSASTLVTAPENFWSLIVHYKEKETNQTAEPTLKPAAEESSEKLSEADLTQNEIYILDNLKSWRTMKAEEENIPAYMVLWDQHLMEVAKAKPRTKDELLEVKGFSEKRAAKYGDEILTILSAF